MNNKMMTTHNCHQVNLKKTKTKTNKQVEQEQNQRYGDHTESFQWGGRGEEWGEKVR